MRDDNRSFWFPKKGRRVWYVPNSDEKLGKDNEIEIEKMREAQEKLASIKSRVAKDNYIRKKIKEGIYL